MTPFGEFLEQLRRRRMLQQKQLAAMMGINPCYVSAMERGKKGPPSDDVLKQLIKNLELTDHEQKSLWPNVELSDTSLRLPTNMSRSEHELVHELKSHLGSISDEQAQVIKLVLKMRTDLGLQAANSEVIGM